MSPSYSLQALPYIGCVILVLGVISLIQIFYGTNKYLQWQSKWIPVIRLLIAFGFIAMGILSIFSLTSATILAFIATLIFSVIYLGIRI